MAGRPPTGHPVDGAVVGRVRRARGSDLHRAADRSTGRVQPCGGGRRRSADRGPRPSRDRRDGMALGAARASAVRAAERGGREGPQPAEEARASAEAVYAFEATPDASGTFTPVTRFFPARLLVYIARSALIISSSAVPPSSG